MTDTRADRLPLVPSKPALASVATILSLLCWAGCGNSQSERPLQPDSPTRGDASQPGFRQAAWDDAGREATQDGLQLRIERVAIEPVTLVQASTAKGRDAAEAAAEANRTTHPLLMIQLRLENVSEETKLRYIGWASPSAALGGITARLQDEQGKPIRLHAFPQGMAAADQVVRPTDIIRGEPLADILVFEVPPARSSQYLLELPAENFGGDGNVRLKIPAAAIERKP